MIVLPVVWHIFPIFVSRIVTESYLNNHHHSIVYNAVFWELFPLYVPIFCAEHGTKGFSLLSGLGLPESPVF